MSSERNRHHILFPRKPFIKGRSLSYRKIAADLRGEFIVLMSIELHNQLHAQLNVFYPQKLRPEQMPSSQQLKRLQEDYLEEEQEIQHMRVVEKINWLIKHLDHNDPRNRNMLNALIYQSFFFKMHPLYSSTTN